MDDATRKRNEISGLAKELVQLARNAPAQLSQRVARLSVREQAELALRLPVKQRLELLLHAPKPMRLVRALPDSEYYLTVRGIGPTDALPLISLGSADQLHHLVDLESWCGDRFDGDRAGAWVALMLEAGEPAARRFLRSADDELLALLFQQWVRPQPIEPDDGHQLGGTGQTEAGDELGLVSPDGYYRFSPSIKEHAAAVQRITQIFFRDDPDRYSRILWATQYELPSSLEEDALRWRQSRLEEHGFPPWEEALSIYAPPAGARDHPRPPESADPDGLAAPRSPMRLPAVRDRLGAALDGLSGEVRERAFHELVGLANHLLVADGAEPREPAAHREALDKGAGSVNIALEARGADEPDELQRVLADVPLIELFREGHARAVELQGRARALTRDGWGSDHPRALELLDSPIRERIDALLLPRPLYYGLGTDDDKGGSRPFRSLGEIEQTQVALAVAELVGRVMAKHLGLNIPELIRRSEQAGARTPRHSAMLLTLLAWHATRGELRNDPLPPDAVSDFLRNVASRRTAAPDAPERALDALTLAAMESYRLTPRETSLLRGFGKACLERLREECSTLDPGIPPDPGQVECLLLE